MIAVRSIFCFGGVEENDAQQLLVLGIEKLLITIIIRVKYTDLP